jgi:subtilase family serine protease
MQTKTATTLLLVPMLLCIFTLPQAYCITNADENTSTYHAQPNANAQSYAQGFLANTVYELRSAYNLNSLYSAGYDGKGQTVVIVDAYGSPTIYQDLLLFIQWQNTYNANLPWTSLNEIKNHLKIYYPLGKPAFDATDSNQLLWSTEVTLDVDMVHAVAPKADIALVIVPTDDDKSLNYAVGYAVKHHLGSTISLSWGTPEYMLMDTQARRQVAIADSIFKSASEAGITIFASAGDWGASNGAPGNNALFPASDPYVTAVGGTNLFMDCIDGYQEGTQSWDGQNHVGIKYSYEIAGNDYQAMVADGFPTPFDMVTTGGAVSALFPLPSWQKGITLTYANGTSTIPTGRCVADVSFNSGVYGGLGAIFLSAASPSAPTLNVIGGTSAGSPFWAALTAIACQYAGHSLGCLNPQLYAAKNYYKTGAFHDIAIGDNTYPTGNDVLGYAATRGWDAPTGIGSPDATVLVPKLDNHCHFQSQSNYNFDFDHSRNYGNIHRYRVT